MGDDSETVRAPWQYEWKQPQWKAAAAPAVSEKDEGSSSSLSAENDSIEGQCLCMTSAQISEEELTSFTSAVQNTHGQDALVLTVTVLSSPFCTNDEGSTKGDLLVLEVTRQFGRTEFKKHDEEGKELVEEEENEGQHVVVLKKVLRWPGVALKDTVEQRESWRHNIPVWLGGLRRPQKMLETTGILSACLCRRLQEHDPKTAAALDALDTMTFLSLGMDPEPNNNNNNNKPQESTMELGGDQEEAKEDKASPVPELVLACLCSDGSVHVYCNPLKLLIEQEDNQADTFATTMSNFFLGSYVFEQLQNNIWPLSQPEATVKLSAQLKKQQRSERAEQDNEEANTGGGGQTEESSSVSMWDKSVWDPTVDPFTAIYRTRDNIPTHCVAAFEYLVIAGRGVRIKRRRDKKKRTPNDVPKPGGFITILSLRHYSEIRTLFLPFSPKHVSPFVWGGMQFIFVFGYQGVAVAIRIDISVNNSIMCGEAPTVGLDDPNEPMIPTVSSDQSLQSLDTTKRSQKAPAFIHRFQILPIQLPQKIMDETEALDVATSSLFGSSPFTFPPRLAVACPSRGNKEIMVVQQSLDFIDYYKARDANLLFQGYRRSRDRRILCVGTAQESRHVARIALIQSSNEEKSLWSETLKKNEKISCHLGQGWCLIGISERMYFICWEGATASRGAFVKEFKPLGDNSNSSESHDCGLFCGVLPLNPYDMEQSIATYSIGKSLAEDLAMPVAAHDFEGKERRSDDSGDDVVVRAIQSLSGEGLSSGERSKRLLEHCTTWIQLDGTIQNRLSLERQIPALIVRLQKKVSNPFLLSIRQAYAENGVATPFYQILSWLSSKKDYFTAASVALDLLRDASTLQHLWRTFDRIDEDDERTKLEGLLDGIIPLHDRMTAALNPNSEDYALLKSAMTQLADMTVGCLTRGGFCMSSTLEYFLKLDSHYDTLRATLVLAATAIETVSNDEKIMLSAMGDTYKRPEEEDQHIVNTLWPVRCLLQAGVARGELPTALALVNVAIPQELRRNQQMPTADSMKLCLSLVKLIIASAPEAIELLLDLTQQQTRERFWGSLHHETRLELALILIDEKCPMLRQGEVRAWTLRYLENSLRSEGAANVVVAEPEQVPTPWLKNICSACLVNARCDIGGVLGARDSVVDGEHNEDGLKEHIEELRIIREALSAGNGSGGLDFGLFIPALLLLDIRKLQWNDDAWVTTQSLLNAACSLAGRVTAEEPVFSFDGISLMKQCTIAGNVCAGANLVGGKNGLILECCSLLMDECEMSMEQAESFLCHETIETQNNESSKESEKVADDFTLGSAHKHVLWLLDQHVLGIRTYGEFDATPTRGRVDPVFAARVCLRTWYSLTKSQLPTASSWLASWLRSRLGMEDDKVSNRRLACAALTRVLLWSTGLGGGCVLAEHLELESKFLVQLSQASWNVVESVPPTVADELLEQDASDGVSSPLKRTSTSDTSSFSHY